MRLRDALLPPVAQPTGRFGDRQIRTAGYVDLRGPRAVRQMQEMLAPPEPDSDRNLPSGCSGDDAWCELHGIRSPAPEHHTHVRDNAKNDPHGVMGLYQSDEDRATAALENVAAIANAQAAQAEAAQQAAVVQQMIESMKNDPGGAAELLRYWADQADQEAAGF